MSLFTQSTKTSAAAKAEIADSAGASADAEMLARAGRSLDAAYGHFNNYANWQFTLVEAPMTLVTGPFTVTGCSATANAYSMNITTTGHGVLPDDFITGPIFSQASRVTATATAAGGLTGVIGFAEPFSPSLTDPAGAVYTLTANRDYYPLPSDFKQMYSVRMLGAQYTLRPIGRRHYDRSVTNEFVYAGTPLYYDVFGIGGLGKVRLLRPPASTDRMQLRYYRRMISSAATLDIPQDFDQYLVAWAKWHFLTDKADGTERANTWLKFANNGLTQMVKQNETRPDEDLMFLPGHYSMNVALGPNSVRPYLDEW